MTLTLDVGAGGGRLAAQFAEAQGVIERNTVPGRSAREPHRFLRAGGGYPDPWTRDASLNAWLGASWLTPQVAAATLDMVCRDEPEPRHVARDNQWWDQIVWVVAAWNHALATGDAGWVRRTWDVGTATLDWLTTTHFDPDLGLFRGPAVMADGISGYPQTLHDPARAAQSFVLDHEGLDRVACLSTNCLYVWAMDALIAAGRALNQDTDDLESRSSTLRASIARAFTDDSPTGWAYVIADGRHYGYQEGLGLALVLLSGVTDPTGAARIVAQAHEEPAGLPAVWPAVGPEFVDRFGRHNQACWPLIMGLWALAVATTGDAHAFGARLASLSNLLGDGGFFELYDPTSGVPDGGWQAGRWWASEPDQTWTATALVGCVLRGLVGLRPGLDGLRLRPCVPAELGHVRLSRLGWRGATLTITITGSGAVTGALLDGDPIDPDGILLGPDASGAHDLTLTLGPTGAAS